MSRSESVGSCARPLLPRRLFQNDEGTLRDALDAAAATRPVFPSSAQERHSAPEYCPLKPVAGLAPHASSPDGRHWPEKQCPCGRGPCVILTSRTERNPGRQFYSCPAVPRTEKCGMFSWCDMVSTNHQPVVCNPVKPFQQPVFDSQTSQRYNVNSPVNLNKQCSPSKALHPICSCRAGHCSVLTMQHGENAGRKYFACFIKKGQGACDHFQWVDCPGPSPETVATDFGQEKLLDLSLVPEQSNQRNMDGAAKDDQVVDHESLSFAFLPDEHKSPKVPECKVVQASSTAIPGQVLASVPFIPESPPISPQRQYRPSMMLETSPIKRLNLHDGSPTASRLGQCYRCGKQGHWVGKCTESPISSCFKCGKPGHWKKDCPG